MFALTKKLGIYEGKWINNGKQFCLKEYRSCLQKNQIITVFSTKEETEKLRDYIIDTKDNNQDKKIENDDFNDDAE